MRYKFPVNLIVTGIMATIFLVAFLIKQTHFGWENRIRNKQLHMEVIPGTSTACATVLTLDPLEWSSLEANSVVKAIPQSW